MPGTGDQQTTAQALIKGDVDYAAMTTPKTIKETLAQNSKLLTHSEQESPYGYVDWCQYHLRLTTQVNTVLTMTKISDGL